MGFKFQKNINFRKAFKAKFSKSVIIPKPVANSSRYTKLSLRKNKTILSFQKKRKYSVKKTLTWILTAFLTIFAFVYLPHISGIIALITAVIAAPIEKWQNVISQYIKGKLKTIIVTIMAVLAICTTPSPDFPESTLDDTTAAATESLETTLEDSDQEVSIEAVKPVEIESISFDEEVYNIGVGRTADIHFMLYPINAHTDTIEVSISNTEVAVISLEKKNEHIICITAIAPGEATITLKSGETITAVKDITVVEVLPETITITSTPKTPRLGSTGVFTAQFSPEDVTNQHVTWQSDAPDILKVNEDGSFEALAIGEAIITATHESGIVGTLRIEVLPIVAETITLSTNWDEGKPFYKNDYMTLTAEISPENVTDKTLTWTSSDESVAVVSADGVVKAIAPGTVSIVATATNGKTGKYEITVDPSPQKFRISVSITMISNDHVGNNWSKGCEFNGETIYSGSVISITPGETFTVCGWAQDNDSNPDYGTYSERITLTNEMCSSSFTIEGEAYVHENGGRYRGNCAVWYVKITLTPIS